MDEVLFRVLAEAVARYLDSVDRAASGQETRRLVAAWRAVLRLHDHSGHGCRQCRERRAVCGVWRVAVGYFLHRLPADRTDRRRLS